MITKLHGSTTTYSNLNSHLYSADTYNYNPNAKDGDLAGRVLIEPDEAWQVLLLNNKGEDQTIIFEYGAAVKTVLTYVGLTVSTLALAYLF